MNAKILKLKSQEPDDNIIKCLEHCLEQAKTGALVSVIVIMEYPESYKATWTGCQDKAKRLGMLELTKMNWLMGLDSDG